MKKLLLIATLMLALVFTVVACTGGETPDDTTVGDTTVETPTDAPTEEPTEEPTDAPTEESTDGATDAPTEEPTDAPTEEPTEPPTEEPTEEPTADPADPVWILDAEALDKLANDAGASNTAAELKDGYISLTAEGGDPWFMAAGNLGAMPEYLVIRYRTNASQGGEIFIGNGAGPVGGQSFLFNYNANSEWNLLIFHLPTVAPYMTDPTVGYIRFDYYTGGSDAGFLDVAYMAFFNSAEYALAYDFEQYKAPMWDADKSVVAHQSFDQFFYGDGSQDDAAGADSPLNLYHAATKPEWDFVADMVGSEYTCLTYWGWIATTADTIGQFGYQVGMNAPVFDDAWTHATEQGVLDAAAVMGGVTGSRMKIRIDTTDFDGETPVRVLYKDADGNTVCLNEVTVIAPVKLKDTTDIFTSDVASNEEGTDLQASDLANFFTIMYGASEPHAVTGGAYSYGGINEMYAAVNGKYAYSVNMIEAAETAMMFVRGTHVVHSVDVPVAENGLYPINNYYETDGNGHMGGAGVYAAIYGGNLNIYVKVYSDENLAHIALKKYAIPTEATELTIADDGETLYFIAGGKLLATIALSGETTYEKICDVAEGVTFAQTAVITLADGTTETVENTMVVSTCVSQIGIALRPAKMVFDSVKVQGFSAIEIPDFTTDEPETPDEPTPEEPAVENYLVPQSQWAITGHNTQLNDSSNPMVAAGGIESAALLHQGSIALGEIDLSKYSKAVVMWGCDNSDVTVNHYNANANNRIMLLNAEMSMVMSPAEETIIAGGTYELKGWKVTAFEIDLTGIDYNGPVWLAIDALPGTFALVASVEFIA